MSDRCTEIERKFLVEGDYKSAATGAVHIVQGYLNSDPERTVRVRVRDDEGRCSPDWRHLQTNGVLLALLLRSQLVCSSRIHYGQIARQQLTCRHALLL